MSISSIDTYGLGTDGVPTPMAVPPSFEAFTDVDLASLVGLSVEEAVTLAWSGWRVRSRLVADVAGPAAGDFNRTFTGVGMLLSHESEPWWAAVPVWVGESAHDTVGEMGHRILSDWGRQSPLERWRTVGKTLGYPLNATPEAEWASCLSDLMLCVEARMRHERSYADNRRLFPLDALLDAVTLDEVEEIEAARVLTALRR